MAALCRAFTTQLGRAPLQGVRYAGTYSPLIKRNKVPFVDFETSLPKKALPPATVVAPFTKRKQSMLAKLLKMSPQELYKGRVHMGLSCWKVKHGGRNISGRVTVRQ